LNLTTSQYAGSYFETFWSDRLWRGKKINTN